VSPRDGLVRDLGASPVRGTRLLANLLWGLAYQRVPGPADTLPPADQQPLIWQLRAP
jgi:hypothetical protein